MDYRRDIDGLRSIAVIAVILFHLGFIKNGYLGVDIFFAISGFLITSIIYSEANKGNFKLSRFYERRIRRILPLSLFICLVSLVLGLIYFLPEDIENLGQSIIATNFSINNILMYITSSNYWATKNDYKLLMHTWSLGVEEQFYLIYPFLFLFFQKQQSKKIIYVLIVLTILSLVITIFSKSSSAKFYLLHYRFYELSLGGLAAIYLYNKQEVTKIKVKYFSIYILLGLLIILIVPFQNTFLLNLITVIFTIGILVTKSSKFQFMDSLNYDLLKNRVLVFIGKTSFSLYMWHQVVFALARYSFLEEITIIDSIYLLIVVFILSVSTYYLVELPFRDKKKFEYRIVYGFVIITSIILCSISFYLHLNSGIVRNYALLDISKDDVEIKKNIFVSNRNKNIKYNDDVKDLNFDFNDSTKISVLVIGDSFGRDLVNILTEFDDKRQLEIRYLDATRLEDIKISSVNINLVTKADFILLSFNEKIDYSIIIELESKYRIKIDKTKLFVFGIKDFGYSNGIYFREMEGEKKFDKYFVKAKEKIIALNSEMKVIWGNKYLDILSLISNDRFEVRVFTDEGYLISHDTLHLTKFGAKYFASVCEKEFEKIFFSFN